MEVIVCSFFCHIVYCIASLVAECYFQPGGEVTWNQGINMGHGLERINRSYRGKLPVVIPGGYIRPVVPMIAAKYATECNIAVRNHVPVLKHWREYNENLAVIDLFLGTLRVSTLSQSFSLFRCNKNYFFKRIWL